MDIAHQGIIPIAKPWLGPEEAEAAARTVVSGFLDQGPKVARFEAAFSRTVGARKAVATSSGTAALHLALMVQKIGVGDDVVVPSVSSIETASAPRFVGANPVFADVDQATMNLSSSTIEQALTAHTRAVIVAHQLGVPADMESIRNLCEPKGIAVLEDATCALGSTYLGSPVGTHSTIAAFSFNPRKTITTGEGGMVCVQNDPWAQRLRSLRNHGLSMRSHTMNETYEETGFNYRMTDLQAALGLVQLERLSTIVRRRRHLAMTYQLLLGTVPGVQIVEDPLYGTSNFQSFWILLPDDFPVTRDEFISWMLQNGVSTRRAVQPRHREGAFAGKSSPSLPVADRFARQAIVLPLFPQMTESEQNRVCELFMAAAGHTT